VQNCLLCGGDHANEQYVVQSQPQEEVNYMGNQDRQGNYNNFNQG